jgi:hypothetical protein
MNNHEVLICQNNLMEKISKEEPKQKCRLKHWSSKQLVLRERCRVVYVPPLAPCTLVYSRLMFKCSMTSSSFIILTKKGYYKENSTPLQVHSFGLHNSPPNRILDDVST